ncbi:hypothetical protein EV356DRAFT_532808 [Viridothelium virens]|uniref:Ecp2 effector protein domain-containing protein n=1 Tax=Viridothelium virens TaxID=1048519 RepID=A0A6A6H9I2_VIRVR|nr:hypothetical protein EV356DRAFT_532808 [Viridothelium virens]
MPLLQAVLPFLFLVLPAAAIYSAPPASCFTDNNGKAKPLKKPGDGDSDDIASAFGGACSEFSGPLDVEGNVDVYTATYETSRYDNRGKRPSCSDITSDLTNLVGQCPYGGVLQHFNTLGHKGNVVVELNNGPNTPNPLPW